MNKFPQRIAFVLMLIGAVTALRDLAVDLGSGGPTVRVRTTNGGVRIHRSELAF